MKTTFYLFLVAILLQACESETTTTVIAPGALAGTIRGNITLYDTLESITNNFGLRKIDDASGATIQLEGTPYSTTSNANGDWTLENVPSGIYKSLTISKDGFSSYKDLEFQFLGNGTITINEELFLRSNLSVSIIMRSFEDYYYTQWRDTILLDSNGQDYLIQYLDSTHIPLGRAILSGKIEDDFAYGYSFCYGVLFLSSSPEINPADPSTFKYCSRYGLRHHPLTGFCDFELTIPSLLGAGFQHGEKVYCVVYSGKSGVQHSIYYDPVYSITAYTGLSKNHSEIKSFIMP